MGWSQLIVKDIREHGVALLSLLLGYLLVVMVALEQQKSGAFSMSRFEVVRFSLITVLPLIAFIVGNRLIVREYVGGTRQFVEALPIRSATPLVVKFLFGFFYVNLLAVVVVLLAAGSAGASEAIDGSYTRLLLIKTLAIATLFWSVVFFVSFTGRLRLFLYVALGLALMFIINMPGIDESRLSPIALMERELFVFERDLFPWRDLIGTLALAVLFLIGGFVLALVNEGSLAEQLGKPISRRDMAAFALLGMGCVTVYSTLQKKWETEIYEFSGEAILRSESPKVAVSYIDESFRTQAEKILESNKRMLANFQSDIGLDAIPQLQIALNTDLELTEIEPELLDGVLLTANFSQYGEFEHSMLSAIGMHHLLLSLTNGRWDYETRHWLLDGLARWWSEQYRLSGDSSVSDESAAEHESAIKNELFALAAIANSRLQRYKNPLLIWQTVTDELGFEAADALSYTAVLYLLEIKGRDVVVALAADYINEVVGDSSIESAKRLLNLDTDRFATVTGMSLGEFVEGWRKWLVAQASQPDIQSLVDSVPKITGHVKIEADDSGVYKIVASYAAADDSVANIKGDCVLRHQSTSAFDLETMIYERQRDRQPCALDGVAHTVDSPYAPGDRVYAVLEFESPRFHRPIPLWIGRLQVK